jgi:hypothetical protein
LAHRVVIVFLLMIVHLIFLLVTLLRIQWWVPPSLRFLALLMRSLGLPLRLVLLQALLRHTRHPPLARASSSTPMTTMTTRSSSVLLSFTLYRCLLFLALDAKGGVLGLSWCNRVVIYQFVLTLYLVWWTS